MKFSKIKLTLLTIVIIISCKDDSIQDDAQFFDVNPVSDLYSIDDMNFENVSILNLKSNKKFSKFKITEDLKQLVPSNTFKNGLNDTNLTFDIDTNLIKKISTIDYESYTFNIDRKEDRIGFIENLVLEIKDGKESAYIMSYIPDNDWLANLAMGTENTFKGKVKMEQVLETESKNLDSKSTSCGSTTIYIDTQCPCVGHWPGQSCSCYQRPTTARYSIDTPCPDGSNTETETFITSPSLGGGGVHGTSKSTSFTGLTGLDGELAKTSEILGYILDLSSKEVSWLSRNQYSANLIDSFLTENQNSFSSKTFAIEVIKAHTLYSFEINNFDFYTKAFEYYEGNSEFDDRAFNEALLTLYTNYVDPPWESNSGLYNDIPSLEYTDTRIFNYRGVPITQFKLTNGDVISQGDYGVYESDFKIFYNIQGTTEWFEMPDPTNYQNLSLDFIFNSFWSDLAVPFARYFTPLEDAIILIDGKNFEGVAESRAIAGLFILVDAVPGGKVLKITRKAGHTLSAASPVIKIAIDATTKAQLNLKNQWKNVIANATRARKGNFGEICTDIDFVEKGYDVVHVNRHTTIDPIGDNTGIDHIFKNSVTGEYVIVESKFHGTGGLSTLRDGTRQMSNDWISDGSLDIQSDRLFKAVGGDISLYNDITNNGFERVVGYIQANGTINYKYVSPDGIEINTVFNN